MPKIENENGYPFDRPRIYRIRILGFIDDSDLEMLSGMHASSKKLDSGKVVTTLVGKLTDQAALAGILEILYELHVTILLVEHLNE